MPAMAPHSSTLAWKIPWTEEPGGLQSMGSLRVGHDWSNSLSLFTFMHWRWKWQPTPVFLPGESQGQGRLWAAVYVVTQSRTRLKWLSSSSLLYWALHLHGLLLSSGDPVRWRESSFLFHRWDDRVTQPRSGGGAWDLALELLASQLRPKQPGSLLIRKRLEACAGVGPTDFHLHHLFPGSTGSWDSWVGRDCHSVNTRGSHGNCEWLWGWVSQNLTYFFNCRC